MSGVFSPDRDAQFYLLRQHRQPLGANVARKYIEEFTAPGDLVLDSFAAAPTTARVAVALGRRAIGVDSNPLVAFAARVQTALPAPREITTALARLGEIPKENQLLRDHLEQLYASVCANCGSAVSVEYFIAASEVHAPIAKVYRCGNCGWRRDDATEADRARATEFQPRGLQYHLLIERIIGEELQHADLLRTLLKLYTPRNLYALVTLTLKLDAAFKHAPAHEVLNACLLHALDVGTTLYASPDALPAREPPPTFVEMNIWRAFEFAARALCAHAPGLALARSARAVVQAPTPALFVGHGSARALVEAGVGEGARAALVLSSPARLDPTFWQLSYLWTRWLLGKAASRPLEPLLDEKRQRWGWYGEALTNSLADSAQLLQDGGHIVFAFPAGSHAMIEALCLAAAPVFQLEAFAFRPQRGADAATEFGAVRGDYRVVWARRDTPAAPQAASQLAQKLRQGALVAATEILAARGEPLVYSWVHHQALAKLARAGALAETLAARLPARDNPFQFLRREIEAGFKEGYARDLDHWKEERRVLWLRRQPPRAGMPLADRVEQAAREILAEAKTIARTEFEDRLLAQFPELLTPEPELVEACAAACADAAEDEWRWRAVDPAAELARARELAAQLGARLHFDVQADDERFDLMWRDEKIVPGSSGGELKEARIKEDSHGFVFRARVDLRELVKTRATPLRGFVVIPEPQVALVKEKLRRAPIFLKPLRAAGWEFLRVPFIEMLLASSSLARAELPLAVGLVPAMAEGKEQMELF